jgi:putative DNA primase/helicase
MRPPRSNPGREQAVNAARRVPIESVIHAHRIPLKRVGSELVGPCPKCGGKDRFAVNLKKQVWNCRGCGQHGDVIALEMFLDGCDFPGAVEKLSGQKKRSANGEHRVRSAASNGEADHRISYAYCEPETGTVRYRKIRIERPDGSKTFAIEPKQRGGSEPLLYGGERLADLSEGQPLLIVEGEKKVDRLRALGAVAVSGDTGAKSKWLPSHAQLLRGIDIIFWPDSDEPGERYIEAAARCLNGHAASLHVLRPFGPPDGRKGRDICDWEGGPAEFAALVEGAELWQGPLLFPPPPDGDARDGRLSGTQPPCDEEIHDPLDGLVERVGSDPGAAFTPEVLERLAALKRDGRAAFEELRARLKKAGCRVTALDKEIAGERGRGEERRRAKEKSRNGPDETSEVPFDGHASSEPLPDTQPPQFSEDRLALAFTFKHHEDLRYVAPWGKWYRWTGTHWERETTLAAFDMARKICREASGFCGDYKTANIITKASSVAAVETFARSDRAHVAIIDQWDADKRLLNTPGGTVNLQTGALQPHRREDYCTKLTAVTPGGECPLFLEFLNKIFKEDNDLINYIQKVLSYCLTGDTSLHAMFFGYGTGANGKSVLLSTVSNILGDYCKSAHIDTFTITGAAQHPTDVAGLMGARLVICSEVEQGRRWAESKIKELTGGDRIAARFMRQDFFEFVPQFKLFITGNHKPGLRNVDEAMRRRLHLFPFAVTIPEGERDPHLAEKLRGEWPGILKWMIEGYQRLQTEGLIKPAAVEAATNEYLSTEDALLSWIEECCVCAKQLSGLSSKLFASWKAWAERNGEFVGSQKDFRAKLGEHGFDKDHTVWGTMYKGIALKVDDHIENGL